MGKQDGCDQMVAATGDKSANRMIRLIGQLEKAASEPGDGAPMTTSSLKYGFLVWPLAIVGTFVVVVLSDSINGWAALLMVAVVAVFGFIAWIGVATGITYLQIAYAFAWRRRAMKPGRERLFRVESELWAQVVSLLEERGSKESAHAFLARHFAFFRDNIMVAYEERQLCLSGAEAARDPETATYLWAYIMRSLSALLEGEEHALQAAKEERQANLRQRFPLPPTDTAEADANATTDASSITLNKE